MAPGRTGWTARNDREAKPMAETDREQDRQQAANDDGADLANAPSTTGPNLPRQVERNLESADTGPARGDGDPARKPPP
jgi:hypothetical protein